MSDKKQLTQEQEFMLADLQQCINMFRESIENDYIIEYLQWGHRCKSLISEIIELKGHNK